MKLNKTRMRFCIHCKKHTEHKVALNKKKQASTLSYGSKIRSRRRGRARGMGNWGRYSKPAVTKFKMTGKKTSKKVDIRYECKECKKTSVHQNSFRAKRIEFK